MATAEKERAIADAAEAKDKYILAEAAANRSAASLSELEVALGGLRFEYDATKVDLEASEASLAESLESIATLSADMRELEEQAESSASAATHANDKRMSDAVIVAQKLGRELSTLRVSLDEAIAERKAVQLTMKAMQATIDEDVIAVADSIAEKKALAEAIERAMVDRESALADLAEAQESLRAVQVETSRAAGEVKNLEAALSAVQLELTTARSESETAQREQAASRCDLEIALMRVQQHEEDTARAAGALREDSGKRSSQFEVIEQRLRLEVSTLRTQAAKHVASLDESAGEKRELETLLDAMQRALDDDAAAIAVATAEKEMAVEKMQIAYNTLSVAEADLKNTRSELSSLKEMYEVSTVALLTSKLQSPMIAEGLVGDAVTATVAAMAQIEQMGTALMVLEQSRVAELAEAEAVVESVRSELAAKSAEYEAKIAESNGLVQRLKKDSLIATEASVESGTMCILVEDMDNLRDALALAELLRSEADLTVNIMRENLLERQNEFDAMQERHVLEVSSMRLHAAGQVAALSCLTEEKAGMEEAIEGLQGHLIICMTISQDEDIENADRTAAEAAEKAAHRALSIGATSMRDNFVGIKLMLTNYAAELSTARHAYESSEANLTCTTESLQNALASIHEYEQETARAAVIMREDSSRRSSQFQLIEQRLRLEVSTLRSNAAKHVASLDQSVEEKRELESLLSAMQRTLDDDVSAIANIKAEKEGAIAENTKCVAALSDLKSSHQTLQADLQTAVDTVNDLKTALLCVQSAHSGAKKDLVEAQVALATAVSEVEHMHVELRSALSSAELLKEASETALNEQEEVVTLLTRDRDALSIALSHARLTPAAAVQDLHTPTLTLSNSRGSANEEQYTSADRNGASDASVCSSTITATATAPDADTEGDALDGVLEALMHADADVDADADCASTLRSETLYTEADLQSTLAAASALNEAKVAAIILKSAAEKEKAIAVAEKFAAAVQDLEASLSAAHTQLDTTRLRYEISENLLAETLADSYAMKHDLAIAKRLENVLRNDLKTAATVESSSSGVLLEGNIGHDDIDSMQFKNRIESEESEVQRQTEQQHLQLQLHDRADSTFAIVKDILPSLRNNVDHVRSQQKSLKLDVAVSGAVEEKRNHSISKPHTPLGASRPIVEVDVLEKEKGPESLDGLKQTYSALLREVGLLSEEVNTQKESLRAIQAELECSKEGLTLSSSQLAEVRGECLLNQGELMEFKSIEAKLRAELQVALKAVEGGLVGATAESEILSELLQENNDLQAALLKVKVQGEEAERVAALLRVDFDKKNDEHRKVETILRSDLALLQSSLTDVLAEKVTLEQSIASMLEDDVEAVVLATAEKQRAITTKVRAVAEKDEAIAEKEQAIAERIQALTEKEQAVTDAENALVDKMEAISAAVVAKEEHLAAVALSSSSADAVKVLEATVKVLEDDIKVLEAELADTESELGSTKRKVRTAQAEILETRGHLQSALSLIHDLESRAERVSGAWREDVTRKSLEFKAVEQKLKMEVSALQSYMSRSAEEKIDYELAVSAIMDDDVAAIAIVTSEMKKEMKREAAAKLKALAEKEKSLAETKCAIAHALAAKEAHEELQEEAHSIAVAFQSARNNLASTESRLLTSHDALKVSQSALISTQRDLAGAKVALARAVSEVEHMQGELAESRRAEALLKSELQSSLKMRELAGDREAATAEKLERVLDEERAWYGALMSENKELTESLSAIRLSDIDTLANTNKVKEELCSRNGELEVLMIKLELQTSAADTAMKLSQNLETTLCNAETDLSASRDANKVSQSALISTQRDLAGAQVALARAVSEVEHMQGELAESRRAEALLKSELQSAVTAEELVGNAITATVAEKAQIEQMATALMVLEQSRVAELTEAETVAESLRSELAAKSTEYEAKIAESNGLIQRLKEGSIAVLGNAAQTDLHSAVRTVPDNFAANADVTASEQHDVHSAAEVALLTMDLEEALILLKQERGLSDSLYEQRGELADDINLLRRTVAATGAAHALELRCWEEKHSAVETILAEKMRIIHKSQGDLDVLAASHATLKAAYSEQEALLLSHRMTSPQLHGRAMVPRYGPEYSNEESEALFVFDVSFKSDTCYNSVDSIFPAYVDSPVRAHGTAETSMVDVDLDGAEVTAEREIMEALDHSTDSSQFQFCEARSSKSATAATSAVNRATDLGYSSPLNALEPSSCSADVMIDIDCTTPNLSCVLVDAIDSATYGLLLAEAKSELVEARADIDGLREELERSEESAKALHAQLEELNNTIMEIKSNEVVPADGSSVGDMEHEVAASRSTVYDTLAPLTSKFLISSSNEESDTLQVSVDSMRGGLDRHTQCLDADRDLLAAKLRATEDAYRMSEEVLHGLREHLNDARAVIKGLRSRCDEMEAEAGLEAEVQRVASKHSIALATAQAQEGDGASDSAKLIDLRCELAAAESQKESQVWWLTKELEQMKKVTETLKSELDALRSLTTFEDDASSHSHSPAKQSGTERHATRLALELSCGELERSQKECRSLQLQNEEALQALSFQKSAREAAEARERDSSGQKSKLQDHVIKVPLTHHPILTPSYYFVTFSVCLEHTVPLEV